MPRLSVVRRMAVLSVVIVLSACAEDRLDSAEPPVAGVPRSSLKPAAPAAVAGFDADRAFGYLETICDIGPRISGTPGMVKQQDLIDEHFTKLGAKVYYQDFDTAHPVTGEPVSLRNMIVSWNPDARERVLLCCHFDTRPRPDQEPYAPNREQPFIGANDGASGVALFMEMAHQMPGLQVSHGVDFIFFDAEELIYDPDLDRERYFLGSKYFATQYRDRPPQHRYVAGVLVDMIGDKKQQLYLERNSLKFAPDVTRSVWASARKAGIRSFINKIKHEVRDDHLPLNEIAGIPTCDIIDFDYPYWHTRNDLPAACSGESMKNVGQVLFQWLQDGPPAP